MKQKQILQTALSWVMLPVNIWVLPWYPTCYVHIHRPQFSNGEGGGWEVGKLLHKKKHWFLYYLPTPWPFCLLQVSNFGQNDCLENLLLMIRLLVWNCFGVWEFKFWPFWCRRLGYGTWRKTMPPMTATVCIFGEFVHSCFALEWLYPLFTGFVIVNCEEILWWESALTTDHEQNTM